MEQNVPFIPFDRVRDITAVAVESTISHVINAPEKSRPRRTTVTNLDTFQQDAIGIYVYSFSRRKEYPTAVSYTHLDVYKRQT